MMRGSDSTTAMSSRRPPMTAGPMLRKRRFLSAASYDDCAKALAANPESASAALKMEMRDSFLECMRVSLNRSYCTSAGAGVLGRRIMRCELSGGEPAGIGRPAILVRQLLLYPAAGRGLSEILRSAKRIRQLVILFRKPGQASTARPTWSF